MNHAEPTSTATAHAPRMNGLRQRHEMLEARIEALRATPSADDMEIKTLKREKLRLKEKMEGLRS